MDLRQLKYFVTIVEEGQITLAAKKLNMAQPPLSQQLINLEKELGTKLLIRNGRSLELTEAGEILYTKGKKHLYNFDDIINEVKEAGGGLRGTLNIGTAISCICYLPERIHHFQAHYPHVTFKIWEGDPFRLSDYILDRKIELAIVRSPIEKKNFSYIPIEEEPFVCILPLDWPVGSKTNSVTMEELSVFPLVALHRVNGEGIYEMLLEEFTKRGLKPKIVAESPNITILLSLVESGVGAAILPSSASTSYSRDNLKVLSINDCHLSTGTYAIWLKNGYLSQIAKRFLETFNKNSHHIQNKL
ncbi:LysR family transcriptional regulator [Cytobacillus firmus]|uniref:Transcriptional regulator, LysR family n=1 Tax=Cytobacillus firmus TaxID=1399 RepID=A0A800NBU4_CYTFI|nr:LysR family transcriptional regulator [Cytobacillus firmus]KAF0824935.1 Transcriptional regulator, LysR family [Cytobacillus firmus]